ncbi:BlaI/MecI/CopY family transcriptional regulator [Neolewinella antarctica]|uniref:Transcriptional regulator n=1 Tax=Neolewinella antarctica TaxID=442734 RepID=A0ABX0XG63_9BACT|nr:BlaI/MecI/CopY family transcriptional regulator [Neolewinella antarctica]NJC27868.1 putative transcriptional regulator [Neolewinella antarctica]
MADKTLPSDAELLLLQALWENPGGTVQDVHAWGERAGKDVGYTTVLTQLQRMHRKGLVTRKRDGKQHRYDAVRGREETETALVDRLSQTAFAGSPVRLALRALGNDRPTTNELEALERWLIEQKNRK